MNSGHRYWSGLSTSVGIFLVLALSNAAPAYADQCAVIPKAQADKAVWVLNTGSTDFLQYCEPCNDPKPTAASVKNVRLDANKPAGKNRAVEAKAVKGGYTVFVNDAPIDVAYAYYHMNQGQDDLGVYTVYRNIAKLVGCSTKGVTENITVHDRDTKKEADEEKLKRQRLEAPKKISVAATGCSCTANHTITVTCRLTSAAEVPVDVTVGAASETGSWGFKSAGAVQVSGLSAGKSFDSTVITKFSALKDCSSCKSSTCTLGQVVAK
jgi:hypothetical protein